MFQYCLFDLDGTLTDPKEGITKSVQYALRYFGIEVENLECLIPFIGPPLKDSFMQFYDLTQEQAIDAIRLYRERFAPIGVLENKLYPGITDMLQRLKDKGIKLAVASSKPIEFVLQIANHFEIAQYFDVIVGSELDGTRGTKEEVVEEALKQLAIPKENRFADCAMIGDRRFDIEGAKEHGLTGIGVTFGYAGAGELEEAGADFIVNSIEELTQLLITDNETVERRKNAGIF